MEPARLVIALVVGLMLLNENSVAGENADAHMRQVAEDAPMGDRSHAVLTQMNSVTPESRGKVQQIQVATIVKTPTTEDMLSSQRTEIGDMKCAIDPEDEALVERMRLSGRQFNDDCTRLSSLDQSEEDRERREQLLVEGGLLAAENNRMEAEAASERELEELERAREAALSSFLFDVVNQPANAPGN